jgi:predicted aspartyl protease
MLFLAQPRSSKMTCFPTLIIWFATLHSIGTATPAIRKPMRFEDIGKHIIAVPVLLNGRGPFQFVVDTGTDTSIIDSRLASSLGLRPAGDLTLLTPAGQKTASSTFVQVVAAGDAVVRDIEVIEMKLDSVFPGTRVKGILGQNFLQAFNVYLDYGAGTLSLLAAGSPSPIRGVRVPVTFEHGRPAVLSKMADGPELRLLLDSGTSSLVLFKPDIPNFRRCTLQSCRQTLTTTASASTVVSGTLSSLVIGDASLRDVPASYSGEPAAGDTIDAILPTALFRSVYINNYEAFAIIHANKQ